MRKKKPTLNRKNNFAKNLKLGGVFIKISCNIKEIIVTQANLGRALGVSGARINQMIKEGIAVTSPEDAGGGVLLFDSLKNYFTIGNGSAGSDEDVDYNKQHARLEKIKADQAEIKLKLLDNSVIYFDDAVSVIADSVVTCRNILQNIPAKVSSQLYGTISPTELNKINDTLTVEIEEALNAIANTRPEDFIRADNEKFSEEVE